MDELLDRAPCGFLSFGDDGILLDVNATLAERLGYEPAALRGRPVDALLTVASRIFHQTHLFPLLRLHGQAEEIFLILRGREGGEVAGLANAQRRETPAGVRCDLVFMEIRERRKYEEALLNARRTAERAESEVRHVNEQLQQQAVELEVQQQQLVEQSALLEEMAEGLQHANAELERRMRDVDRARQEADAANHAKSEFLAMMSHELRTPLNAIGGYAELLGMGIHGPVTAQQREALGRIERSQRHLLRLVNDVLNLARIEAGRVDYVVEPFVVAEVVASVMPMVEPQIGARGLTCTVDVDGGIVACGDREKVQQILLNLLTNAVKFTPPGGQLRVDTARRAGLSHLVFVRVTDTGIGIPRDRLAQVFDPFVQVDTSRAGRVEGTGLGLTISRDLARGMGGELRARSEPGKGSTFTLALPIG